MTRRSRFVVRAALVALVALAGARPAAAAPIVKLFADSPDTTQWIASWGEAAGGSTLTMVAGTHVPVVTSPHYLGTNALRLAWTAATGGDWVLTVANANWAVFDPTPDDTLVFVVWSATALPAAELPRVFLEDADNRRTPPTPMSAWTGALPAATWARVAVPLAVFRASPGGADLARINKVFFGQSATAAPGVPRTLVVDEIRFVPAGLAPPATPVTSVRAWERHLDVRWDAAPVASAECVRIERADGAGWTRVADAHPDDAAQPVWLGAPDVEASVRATAIAADLRESAPSPTSVARTRTLSDNEWLDMTEEAAFRYFWDHGHPVSGLARERYGAGQTCTTGGTGMGVLAIIVAAERGWVPRVAACERIRRILDFYDGTARTFHGAYSHWYDGTTGAALPFDAPDDSSMDVVETSYLIQGALTARQYFDGAGADELALRAVATRLWERMDWNAFRPASPGNALFWLWSPKYAFANSFPLAGWNEAMIGYVLAVASPTHSIPASCYPSGWARYGAMVNNKTFYGYRLWVGPDYGGGLYLNQYTFMTLDPRFKRDAYANYQQQCRNAALIDRIYCAANPGGFAGYSSDIWGLTASDDPWGYSNRGPYSGDNGTIAPTAALGMMPFTYGASLAALKAMYRQYGAALWGPFGFRDAFNPAQGWTASSYIAIDQGPIVAMLENARTQLLWNRFMRNPEIAPALAALGFVPDSAAVSDVAPPEPGPSLALAPPRPNPFTSETTIAFTLERPETVEVTVLGIDGARVATLARGARTAGPVTVRWDGRATRGRRVPPGVYLIRVVAGDAVATARVQRLR